MDNLYTRQRVKDPLTFVTLFSAVRAAFYTSRAVADLRGSTRDAPPPPGSKFFQFHAVFGKCWQNRMLAPPPPGELVPPPWGNPGSATGEVLLLTFLEPHYVGELATPSSRWIECHHSAIVKGNEKLYSLLPPATKLAQGYIFTGICDSVHRGGVPGQVHPPTRYTPPGPGTPPGSSACWEKWATSGRYASYWKALLPTTGISWTIAIAWTISCIVIAIVGHMTSVNVPT